MNATPPNTSAIPASKIIQGRPVGNGHVVLGQPTQFPAQGQRTTFPPPLVFRAENEHAAMWLASNHFKAAGDLQTANQFVDLANQAAQRSGVKGTYPLWGQMPSPGARMQAAGQPAVAEPQREASYREMLNLIMFDAAGKGPHAASASGLKRAWMQLKGLQNEIGKQLPRNSGLQNDVRIAMDKLRPKLVEPHAQSIRAFHGPSVATSIHPQADPEVLRAETSVLNTMVSIQSLIKPGDMETLKAAADVLKQLQGEVMKEFARMGIHKTPVFGDIANVLANVEQDIAELAKKSPANKGPGNSAGASAAQGQAGGPPAVEESSKNTGAAAASQPKTDPYGRPVVNPEKPAVEAGASKPKEAPQSVAAEAAASKPKDVRKFQEQFDSLNFKKNREAIEMLLLGKYREFAKLPKDVLRSDQVLWNMLFNSPDPGMLERFKKDLNAFNGPKVETFKGCVERLLMGKYKAQADAVIAEKNMDDWNSPLRVLWEITVNSPNPDETFKAFRADLAIEYARLEAAAANPAGADQ